MTLTKTTLNVVQATYTNFCQTHDLFFMYSKNPLYHKSLHTYIVFIVSTVRLSDFARLYRVHIKTHSAVLQCVFQTLS